MFRFVLILFVFLTYGCAQDTPQLFDPEQAPTDIREKVMMGFKIMQQTQEYASQYAGDRVTCNNCHFDGGNSLGGENNGISLVGVSQVFPRYSARAKRTISLKQRINYCFERSLNGKPLPEDSKEMEALIAYFNWISQGAKEFKSFPWLGLKSIKSSHMPNIKNGEELYQNKCATCHQSKGQGLMVEEQMIPPIAGDQAFNDGAGMATSDTFSAFIYKNMPLGAASLTEEESLDITAYVLSLPRPKYQP